MDVNRNRRRIRSRRGDWTGVLRREKRPKKVLGGVSWRPSLTDLAAVPNLVLAFGTDSRVVYLARCEHSRVRFGHERTAVLALAERRRYPSQRIRTPARIVRTPRIVATGGTGTNSRTIPARMTSVENRTIPSLRSGVGNRLLPSTESRTSKKRSVVASDTLHRFGRIPTYGRQPHTEHSLAAVSWSPPQSGHFFLL